MLSAGASISWESLRALLSRPGLALLALGLFVQLSGFLFNNDGSRQATQVYLLLFVPALVLLTVERLALPLWRQPCALALLALLGWVVLRSCFGDSLKTPGYLLKVALLILLYLFAISHLISKGVIGIPLALAVLLACCFAWLTLIVQFVVLDKPLEYEVLRSTGRLRELGWHSFADFSHPISAGLYYGIFAVLLLSVLVERELKAWTWLLVLIGLTGLLVYVLLTFSRGAWFSTLAGSLTLLLLSPQRRARLLLLIGALLILMVMTVFWSQVEHEWFLGTSQRGPIWLSWFARFPEFWALGKGAGVNLIYQYPWGISRSTPTACTYKCGLSMGSSALLCSCCHSVLHCSKHGGCVPILLPVSPWRPWCSLWWQWCLISRPCSVDPIPIGLFCGFQSD